MKKWFILSSQDTWVKPYFKKNKWLLMLVLGLGCLTFFSAAALMFTSGYLISKSATHPENLLLVYVPIVLTRGFGIARPALRYIERLASHDWVLRMTSDLRLKLYRSLESTALNNQGTHRLGDLLGVLAEDIEHIQNLYLRTIFPAVIAILLYVGLVIGLGSFSWPFALLMLILLGSVVILLPLVAVTVNQARSYRRKDSRNRLYTILTDGILGVGDWQYSGRFQTFINQYEQAELAVRECDQSLRRYHRLESLIKQVIFGLVIVFLFIWSSTFLTGGDASQLNWIAAFVLAFFPLIDAFAPVSTALQELPIYDDTVQRLAKLPDGTVSEPLKTAIMSDYQPQQIVFNDVSFAYEHQPQSLLKMINLSISCGQVIALLGRSGAGKSTLASLLRGDLVPTTGDIFVDHYPIQELLANQSQLFGVLNQRPHIFDASLKQNIQMGNLSASETAIKQAIHLAGLDEVVQRLPQGSNTWLEEGGNRLSGGERQRVALARLLLQDTPIVIIDEPMIGLDPLTEQQLIDTLFKALKGKTIIWITHHLLGIEHADQVLFLADGQIETIGSPEHLYQENERYRQLYLLDRGE